MLNHEVFVPSEKPKLSFRLSQGCRFCACNELTRRNEKQNTLFSELRKLFKVDENHQGLTEQFCDGIGKTRVLRNINIDEAKCKAKFRIQF